jgi:SAM-dependent methyltransferase
VAPRSTHAGRIIGRIRAPRGRLALCLLASACVAATAAQARTQPGPPGDAVTPRVGQAGKDIVWLPTPDVLVERMLDLARVTPRDVVVDLGAGDGRIVIAAAARGAQALGVEYAPELVELSRSSAARAGVADRARFVQGDLFAADLSKATVITLFLGTDINLALRPALLDLRPGTRIVSNTFGMGEWEPDETVEVSYLCESWCKALLWLVPARAEGTWTLPNGRLRLSQTFQRVSGTLELDGGSAPVSNGRLIGDELTFHAGAVRITSRVADDTMQGRFELNGQSAPWSAVRTAR